MRIVINNVETHVIRTEPPKLNAERRYWASFKYDGVTYHYVLGRGYYAYFEQDGQWYKLALYKFPLALNKGGPHNLRSIRLTDEEYTKVREFIKTIR